MNYFRHLYLLLLFTIPVSAIAQDPPPRPSAPMPSWQEFSSVEANFKVMMPGKPTEVSQSISTAFGPTPTKLLFGENGAIEYLVMYIDYTITVDTPDITREALAAARDLILSPRNGKIISDREIKYEEYLGREWKANIAKGIMRSRNFFVKQRLYALMAILPEKIDSDPSVGKEITDFFNSFKLLGEPKGPAAGAGAIPKLEAVLDQFEPPTDFFERPVAWREFTSTQGGYKIRLPSEPFEKTFPLDPNNPKLKLTLLMARGEGFVALIMTQHLMAALKDDVQRNYIFKNVINVLLRGINEEAGKEGGAKILSEQVIKLKEYPGRAYTLGITNGALKGSGRCKAYSIGGNIYILVAISIEDRAKQIDLSKFLDSFEPTKAPEPMPTFGTPVLGTGAWREVSYADHGFKVSLPGEPEIKTSNQSGIEIFFTIATGEGMVCLVAHQLLPEIIEPNSPQADSFFSSSIEGLCEISNSKVIGEKKIAQDGRAGREYTLKREELSGAARIFLRGREVHAVVAVPIPPGTNTQSVAKFLDSFKMMDQR